MPLPMNREQAFALLRKHTATPTLLKHALAVEAAMRYFAAHYGEDVEYWGMVGLLHDIDYEKYPDRHCDITPEILRENGFDEAFIRAVLSHGFGLRTEVEPQLTMEKVVYTIDELTGLITAAALVRPSKSLADLEVKSVKKKYKDGAFAASISRKVIAGGAERMGMPLDEVIGHTILALRPISAELGLAGA